MAKKHEISFRTTRTKSKDQIRIEYRKSLAARDVSETSETEELLDMDSTGYVAPTETIESPPSVTPPFDWSKLASIAKIIGTAIAVIAFIATIIYNYLVIEMSIRDLTNRVSKIEEKIDKAAKTSEIEQGIKDLKDLLQKGGKR